VGEVIYAHLHTLISIVGKVSSSHQRSTTSARRTELRCIINGELCDIIIKTPRHRHTESFHFLHYIFRCIKDNTSFELFMGVIHPEPDDKEPNANSTRESAGPATPNRLSNFHYCSPNCQENSRMQGEAILDRFVPLQKWRWMRHDKPRSHGFMEDFPHKLTLRLEDYSPDY
jgi:hypothetical protein